MIRPAHLHFQKLVRGTRILHVKWWSIWWDIGQDKHPLHTFFDHFISRNRPTKFELAGVFSIPWWMSRCSIALPFSDKYRRRRRDISTSEWKKKRKTSCIHGQFNMMFCLIWLGSAVNFSLAAPRVSPRCLSNWFSKFLLLLLRLSCLLGTHDSNLS